MRGNQKDLKPCSERATRGYPALFCERDPSKFSNPVQLFLLLIGSGSPGPIAFLLRLDVELRAGETLSKWLFDARVIGAILI